MIKNFGSGKRLGSVFLLWLIIGVKIFAQSGNIAWSPTVNMSWNTSLDPTVTGYYLYYGTNSGVYPNKINVGFNTAFAASGLVADLTYYFSLTSYNAAGIESVFAPELSFIVPGSLIVNRDSINGGVSIRFPVAPTHSYELQSSTNLATNSWSDILVTPTESSNAWVEYDQPITNTIPKEFFRLILH